MIYNDQAPAEQLEQGDVLRKTEALAALLSRYHPHYAEHAANKFFVVLTQSCDLVRRDGDSCKARYISLAPVRPLTHVVKREFEGRLENTEQGAQAFAAHRVRTTLEQFLQRLINNNEPPFFYFEAAHDRGIPEDLCAIMALPISLKPEHYTTLLAAKIAGIKDVFQAKLGWLLGQMYSRVGTPDFQATLINQMVKSHIEGTALWVDDSEAKALRHRVAEIKAADAAAVVDSAQLQAMLSALPKRKVQAIDAVLKAAADLGLAAPNSQESRKLRRRLDNDLAKFFK